MWKYLIVRRIVHNPYTGVCKCDSPDYLCPIQSARMRTKGSFSMKYGCCEVSAIMPSGDWLWPGN